MSLTIDNINKALNVAFRNKSEKIALPVKLNIALDNSQLVSLRGRLSNYYTIVKNDNPALRQGYRPNSYSPAVFLPLKTERLNTDRSNEFIVIGFMPYQVAHVMPYMTQDVNSYGRHGYNRNYDSGYPYAILIHKDDYEAVKDIVFQLPVAKTINETLDILKMISDKNVPIIDTFAGEIVLHRKIEFK